MHWAYLKKKMCKNKMQEFQRGGFHVSNFPGSLMLMNGIIRWR